MTTHTPGDRCTHKRCRLCSPVGRHRGATPSTETPVFGVCPGLHCFGRRYYAEHRYGKSPAHTLGKRVLA